MRKLTDHIVSGDQAVQLNVEATDEPGDGGAHHHYQISEETLGVMDVHFQNGPIKEVGVNGITHEALLAILIDRLLSFQAGPFKSAENAEALLHLNTALRWLKKRTELRIKRGVEGTRQK